MLKTTFITLSALILLTACGSEDQKNLSLSEHNQACLKGKIKGQFIVEYSNGSHELVSASSNKDFFEKILSKENTDRLNKKNISISIVDFNFEVKAKAIQTHQNQEQHDVNFGPKMIKAPFLWKKGFYGQGAKTALIDSGYDIGNVFLQNSIAVNVFELGNDEDQNGLKGDHAGWDFVNNKPLSGDLGEHGTTVGSVIAAAHTSKYKFGVAPGSKIIPITALQVEDGEVRGDTDAIIKAINYALTRKVDFINASWAGEICSKVMRQKIKEATNKGVIFITSAGNENRSLDTTPIFPSSFPFSLLVSVGAANTDFSKQEDSNFGNIVDFFTLGSAVTVAVPHQATPSTATGTSLSAPFITGGLALLKSAFPTASPAALLQSLEESKNANKIPNLEHAFSILKASK